MNRNRLIFAYFAMFLLFIGKYAAKEYLCSNTVYYSFVRNDFSILVFKKATPEIDKTSSNIAPNIVESDIDTSKIKSDRLQRKIYDIFRDIDDDREEDNNIQSLIKRGKRSCMQNQLFTIKRYK